MSGGYGLFAPTGRLPAHIHDFDESICIIQGSATCIVEGRHYTMHDYSTALQPRGRVHYFINNTQNPMAMLWVYAGPTPERLVVAEKNATVEGNPWR
jgi:quercetin dioxygenase-like cupin family protein